MTGEVTLQGRVLPIGGLKQKVLAAHAAGLQDVILPERNRGDLDDVPEDVREELAFHPVMTLGEVLELALEREASPPCSRRVSETTVPEEVARAADLLGRRWVLAIVYASHGGATRFNEFKRSVVGITPRALAQRLQDLEDAGILERRVYDTRPPRVEYRLTDRRPPPPGARPRARPLRGRPLCGRRTST